MIISCTNHDIVEKVTGRELLEHSKNHYDPDGMWSGSTLSIHIQEPRLGNPARNSVLKINKQDSIFELICEIEVGTVTRIIEKGEPRILLNGRESIPAEIKSDFGLTADRNSRYQQFYEIMYGLPMSLNEEILDSIHIPVLKEFNGEPEYELDITLKEPVISAEWSLIISASDFQLKAIILKHEDKEDELIEFAGKYSFQGLQMPRFRHWYSYNTGQYKGSDIILKTLN